MQWLWTQQLFSCDPRFLHGEPQEEGIRASSCYRQSMIPDQISVMFSTLQVNWCLYNSLQKFILNGSKTILVSIMDTGALDQDF